MKCAVTGCKNDKRKKTIKSNYFSFPTDVNVSKKWITFCRRPKPFNHENSIICRDHFTKDDFSNIVQYEMGFATKLKLKRGVVPTIPQVPIEVTNKEEATESTEGEDSFSTFTEDARSVDYESMENSFLHVEILEETSTASNSPHYSNNVFEEVENLQNQIQALQEENLYLRRVQKRQSTDLIAMKRIFKEREKKYAYCNLIFKNRLKVKTQECKNMEDKLEGIFTKKQIINMKKWR